MVETYLQQPLRIFRIVLHSPLLVHQHLVYHTFTLRSPDRVHLRHPINASPGSWFRWKRRRRRSRYKCFSIRCCVGCAATCTEKPWNCTADGGRRSGRLWSCGVIRVVGVLKRKKRSQDDDLQALAVVDVESEARWVAKGWRQDAYSPVQVVVQNLHGRRPYPP